MSGRRESVGVGTESDDVALFLGELSNREDLAETDVAEH